MARGRATGQLSMLAMVHLEERIPADHPLRSIKTLADGILAELSPLFDTMYADSGRPSIPPEQLLKADLLIHLFSIRSERLFCEELEYHLLYRWFLDMDVVEPGFAPTSFSKNRTRLLEHEVAEHFFAAVVAEAARRNWLSDAHFSVDGTLIEAAASLKSLRRIGAAEPAPPDDPGNPSVDFRKERRSNATHRSTTDPEARLMTKGKGQTVKLSYGMHLLMDNRFGLATEVAVTPATGVTEREAAQVLVAAARLRGATVQTLGADQAYDAHEFVAWVQAQGICPHFVPNRGSAKRPRISPIDTAITESAGYAVSQRRRKRIEEIFGWLKTVGGYRRTRYRGLARTRMAGVLSVAAYNLVRMGRLATTHG